MTEVFDRLWYKVGLTDDDLLKLQIALMTNPIIGDIIVGTGGARKTRLALHDKGKSGGIRVIYVDLPKKNQIFLILCYTKSRQDDLSSEQEKQVKKLVEALKGV